MSHSFFHESAENPNSAEKLAVSRRALLKSAATGLAVAASSKIALAQDQKVTPPGAPPIGAEPVAPLAQPMPSLMDEAPLPPYQRVGFAIVGLGNFAINQIIPSFADCKKSKLVALVSGDADKANALASQHGLAPGNVYNYDNFDSIRDNPCDVKVVYVITPNALHRPFVERAARAGKNVMCEKPLATNSADCRAIISVCRASGVKLMVAYRAQYEPYNLEAIRVCRSGELGKIVSIVADHGRPVDPSKPSDQWRLDKQMAGGGPLPDIGIYSLNACRYLTGQEPTEISAMLYQPTDDPKFKEVEKSVVWTMRFPGNILTTCTTAYDYAETKRFRVFFEKGWLELDPATDYYQHSMKINRPVPKRGTEPGDVVEFSSVTEDVPITPKNQFALELDHMAECVLQNKAPRTPGEEGLRDVQLIETIYQAAREGRTIPVTGSR